MKQPKAKTSIIWSAIERFSVQGIQFLLSIIIARIISPSDYGMIAMLSIFMAIAQTFIDCGFSNALIHKQDKTEKDYSTAFYFNLIVGIICYIILFIFSPFISSFYNQPALNLLTKVIGLNLIINSFSIVQIAKLTIELEFRLQAITSLISVCISGVVAVIMAYKGYGVWSLVVQSLLNNLCKVVLMWTCVKWYPSFSFSIVSFKYLFNFGSKLLLSGLLETIYVNIYSVIIGKKFASDQVGFYNRSLSFALFPSQNLTLIINRVIYPILCKEQNNLSKLKNNFLNYLRLSCLLIFSLMIILCSLSRPIINIVLTPKWESSIELLQILCLAYLWYPVINFNYMILNVVGLTGFVLKSEFIKKIISVIVLVCTIPFGVRIMCIGLVISLFLNVLIGMYFTAKAIKLSIFSQWKELLPVLSISVFMGITINIAGNFIENDYYKIIVEVLVAITSILISLNIFRVRERKIVMNVINKLIIRNK